VRRAALAAFIALLVVPAAFAAGQIKTVETGDFPHVRLTVVAPSASKSPPALTQNGKAVAGLDATNLGSSKSVVIAIDRSRSMLGKPLTDASAAAAGFVAGKPSADRIAVVTFATQAVALTGFSTATIDSDLALRSIAVDQVVGTKLYDAVVLSADLLKTEPEGGRVVILVTDGNETESEASLDSAIVDAKAAGVSVYVIGIESAAFNPEPLKRLSRETGGSYHGAASTEALKAVYSTIGKELQRTWRLQYMTNARPGDRLALKVKFPGGDQVTRTIAVPGQSVSAPATPSPLLPDFFYTSDWGLPVLAGVVGLLVLLAFAFALAAPRGAWLKGRLEPHVASSKHQVIKRERESRKVALFAPLFLVTESVFGNLRHWKKLDAILQRADVPLKTAEFAYIMAAAGFLGAFATAIIQPPFYVIIGGFVGAALIPYAVVAHRARKRLKAFEDQLPDILVTMAASLKAGHSFRQGMQSVVDEGVDPAAHEFKRVLTEARLGRPMDDALTEMASRIGSNNFEFVMSAVTIQRQVGGSLAGLFDMVADTVRQRQQFHRKIRGLTAMGRMSAYVLIGLPAFVGLAIYAINREYMKPLIYTSTGHKLILLIIVMMSIGSLFLKKIVSFKG
jgi:tight adherence protein B